MDTIHAIPLILSSFPISNLALTNVLAELLSDLSDFQLAYLLKEYLLAYPISFHNGVR